MQKKKIWCTLLKLDSVGASTKPASSQYCWLLAPSHYKQPNTLNSAADILWQKQEHFYSADMAVILTNIKTGIDGELPQGCGTLLKYVVPTLRRL